MNSPLHFTYTPPCDEDCSLKQGDILSKTPDLLKMLSEIHPHYANEEYKYFQVITQSCDLVRSPGALCKSRYITLAAVRSLDDIIDRFINENTSAIEINGVQYCPDNQKSKVSEFLRKLFNNNEKEYFFLEKAPTYNITEHCCTLLYLTIAIRSREHYDLCLEAKCLELKDNFQSKLGWLVGNLYSRVGTDDYVPSGVATKKQFTKLLNDTIEDHAAWIPQNRFKEFQNAAKSHNNIEDISSSVEKKIADKKDARIKALLRQLKASITLSDEDEERFKNLIHQDPLFKKLLS